jgi:hypothetical protein
MGMLMFIADLILWCYGDKYRQIHSFIGGLITTCLWSQRLASGRLLSNKTCYHTDLTGDPVYA